MKPSVEKAGIAPAAEGGATEQTTDHAGAIGSEGLCHGADLTPKHNKTKRAPKKRRGARRKNHFASSGAMAEGGYPPKVRASRRVQSACEAGGVRVSVSRSPPIRRSSHRKKVSPTRKRIQASLSSERLFPEDVHTPAAVDCPRSTLVRSASDVSTSRSLRLLPGRDTLSSRDWLKHTLAGTRNITLPVRERSAKITTEGGTQDGGTAAQQKTPETSASKPSTNYTQTTAAEATLSNYGKQDIILTTTKPVTGNAPELRYVQRSSSASSRIPPRPGSSPPLTTNTTSASDINKLTDRKTSAVSVATLSFQPHVTKNGSQITAYPVSNMSSSNGFRSALSLRYSRSSADRYPVSVSEILGKNGHFDPVEYIVHGTINGRRKDMLSMASAIAGLGVDSNNNNSSNNTAGINTPPSGVSVLGDLIRASKSKALPKPILKTTATSGSSYASAAAADAPPATKKSVRFHCPEF